MNKENQQMIAACCGGESPRKRPVPHAIVELEILRDIAQGYHDIALKEERYDDAKRYNERRKSFSHAIAILTAIGIVTNP